MKALLAPAAAAALSLVLFSCQQAYQDKAARDSGSSVPSATLSAPAASPNAVPALNSSVYGASFPTAAETAVTSANASDVSSAVGQLVVVLFGPSVVTNVAPITSLKVLGNVGARMGVTTTTQPSTRAPTAGYQYSTAYTSTPGSGTLLDSTENTAGTYTSSAINFVEESNDYATYAAAPTGIAKLFSRAYHGLLNSSETDAIGAGGAPYSMQYYSSALDTDFTVLLQGTRVLNRRNEWYQDQSVSIDGQTNSQTTSNIYEASMGLVVAAAWDTGAEDTNKHELIARGKFVVSTAASQIYITSTNGAPYGSQFVELIINVDVYDSSNNKVASFPGVASYSFPTQ